LKALLAFDRLAVQIPSRVVLSLQTADSPPEWRDYQRGRSHDQDRIGIHAVCDHVCKLTGGLPGSGDACRWSGRAPVSAHFKHSGLPSTNSWEPSPQDEQFNRSRKLPSKPTEASGRICSVTLIADCRWKAAGCRLRIDGRLLADDFFSASQFGGESGRPYVPA